MRYGLLALSVAMLGSGGVAAQSALNISQSVRATTATEPRVKSERGGSYGSIPFTAARNQSLR